MIDIFINGERKIIAKDKALALLLSDCGFNCARVAVAVNSEFVARSDYENFFLKPNDSVDVVTPVAGG
jgi:thiamine biosynthesis protein ThiS